MHRPKRTAILTTLVLALVLATAPAAAQAPPEGAEADPLPLTGVASVATGTFHSCAVLLNRQVRCWGDNTAGQLGDGTTSSTTFPVVVTNGAGSGPLTGVRNLAAGDHHTCALLANGEVRCWGEGVRAQLGDGGLDNRLRPVRVKDATGTGRLRGVTQISAGGATACARLENGQLRCWGGHLTGQLGNGSPAGSPIPVPVRAVAGAGALTQVTQVDVGATTVCARLASTEARCWGDNADGGLGDGTTDDRLRPVVVRNASNSGPLTGVRHVDAGQRHACATRTDGTLRCWGDNSDGQLGTGESTDSPLPVVVTAAFNGPALAGVAAVDAGSFHTCARLETGQVRCWGTNDDGQIGTGVLNIPDYYLPTPVKNRAGTGNLTGTAQLQSNAAHVCVRLTNRQVRCWGLGTDGQLGNRVNASAALPTVVVES